MSKKNATGTIRIFNADKGWGFVDGDDVGGDIFLHAKHFMAGAPSFWIGHKSNTKDREKAPRYAEGPVRVSFDLALSHEGKPQAINVRLIGEYPGSDGADAADEERPSFESCCWSSPMCLRCGSTVATNFGIGACTLCGQWLPPPEVQTAPPATLPFVPLPSPLPSPTLPGMSTAVARAPPAAMAAMLPPGLVTGSVAPAMPPTFPLAMPMTAPGAMPLAVTMPLSSPLTAEVGGT